ncbi:UDP-glycosyltransferase 89B2-like protein [Tanacetum coccineum]
MNECYDGSTPLTLDDVMKWLDKKPYESVVFICFGTRAALTKQEMIALVNALKHSVVDFILCVKPQNSINISYGFEEIVNDRGLIIRDWIPQFEILAHPAVGSFLNSCGWNSILEGVKAGVMMLAWPMGSGLTMDGDTPERVKVKKLSQALKNRTPVTDLDKFVNFLSNV